MKPTLHILCLLIFISSCAVVTKNGIKQSRKYRSGLSFKLKPANKDKQNSQQLIISDFQELEVIAFKGEVKQKVIFPDSFKINPDIKLGFIDVITETAIEPIDSNNNEVLETSEPNEYWLAKLGRLVGNIAFLALILGFLGVFGMASYGLIAFIISGVGFIISGIAYLHIKKNPELGGRDIALAGMLVPAIFWVISILFYFIFLFKK